METINKIRNFFSGSVLYLIGLVILMTFSWFFPTFGSGAAFAILVFLGIIFSINDALHKERVNKLELEKTRIKAEESLLQKALPPYLVAFPSSAERVVSVRDEKKEIVEHGNARITISFRLSMAISDIERLDEYHKYIKNGMKDVLENSPIYFQLTDDQRKQYQIYNFQ